MGEANKEPREKSKQMPGDIFEMGSKLKGRWLEWVACIAIAASAGFAFAKWSATPPPNANASGPASFTPEIQALLQASANRSGVEPPESVRPGRPPEELWADFSAALELKDGRKALPLLQEILRAKPASYEKCAKVLVLLAENAHTYGLDDSGLYNLAADPAALAAIDLALHEPLEIQTRRTFVRALKWQASSEAEAVLIRELEREGGPSAMCECVLALDGRDTPAARQALLRCMNDRRFNKDVRVAAVLALARLPGPAIDELLASAASDAANASIRETIVHALQVRHPPVAGLLVIQVAPVPEDETVRQALETMLGLEVSPGDVLVSCAGTACNSNEQLRASLSSIEGEDRVVSLQVYRNGKTFELSGKTLQLAYLISRIQSTYVTPNGKQISPAVKAFLENNPVDF